MISYGFPFFYVDTYQCHEMGLFACSKLGRVYIIPELALRFPGYKKIRKSPPFLQGFRVSSMMNYTFGDIHDLIE